MGGKTVRKSTEVMAFKMVTYGLEVEMRVEEGRKGLLGSRVVLDLEVDTQVTVLIP